MLATRGIIALQDGAVYGPIRSRRLGASLGINVLPVSRKVCSSDCVYCQYGWTPTQGPAEPLKRAAALLAEIGEALARHAREQTAVDCITLAGNGEPTLHPDLEELIIGIKRLRDWHFPGAPVGILSDATQLMRPRIRRALALLDARCMKFDAADEATWRRINDPLGRIDFRAMIDGLKALPDLVLQSMFIRGSYDNTDEPHLTAWVGLVGEIRPQGVQVYTIDRPTAAEGIEAVPGETLRAIAERLTSATGIPADVYE